jgi:hypothetical protein
MRAREVPAILAMSVTVRSLLSELEMILLVIFNFTSHSTASMGDRPSAAASSLEFLVTINLILHNIPFDWALKAKQQT